MPNRQNQIITLVFTTLLGIACIPNVYSQSVDPDLYNAFHDAIAMDSFSEVKQFINFGVNVNHRYDGGQTPLMIASKSGSAKVVSSLLKLGADTNFKSGDKMTALDYAHQSNNKFIIALLKNNSYTNKALIKEIQFYLHKLGYNLDPIDGLLGEKTSSALKKFSSDTHQHFPAEISYRQVEILKNTYFGSGDITSKDLAYGATPEDIVMTE